MNNLLKLELIGILVTFVLGFILHNAYDLIKLPIFPVNESIFEHQKLYLLSFIIYTIIEYILLKDPPENFVFSKFIGLVVTICSFIIMYSFYEIVISSEHNFIVTILLYGIALIIGHFFSYQLIKDEYSFPYTKEIGILSFILLTILFILLTYFPPELHLFYDTETNSYGIPTDDGA